MDLKVYYQKLRQAEEELQGPHVAVVSLETPDGGRAGVLTETERANAARMIVAGRARPATAEEAAGFRAKAEEAKRAADQAAAASKVQFTVVSEADLRTLRKSGAGPKG